MQLHFFRRQDHGQTNRKSATQIKARIIAAISSDRCQVFECAGVMASRCLDASVKIKQRLIDLDVGYKDTRIQLYCMFRKYHKNIHK